MSLENRRQFSRILFDTRASILLGEERVPVKLIDVSLRGALVLPSKAVDLPAGTPCALEIFLEGGGVLIRMDTHIAHHQGEHLGLTCHEIDLDSMIHLRRLVELNLGDESILHRELSALTSHD